MSGDIRFWAKRYTDAGFAVIPVPRGEKGPRLADWQKAKVGTYAPDAFGESDNIGVLNGDVSGRTVDADFDAIEAVIAARAHAANAVRLRPSGEDGARALLEMASLRALRAPHGNAPR